MALGREVVEKGYGAFKTNVVVPGDEPQVLMPGFGEGGGTLQADEIAEALVRLLEAFREGTGDAARPIVDLNFNLEPEGCARVARALEPFDLLWLEVDLFDPGALAHVRHVAPMPICSGENLYGSRGFRPFLEAGGMDVASVDVIWNGFHQAKKIADLAETFEVNCAPHNYYSHLATFIAAQWCAAIPNARILELDVDDVPWRDELVTAVPEIADGELRVPAGPGWGLEVREDVLARASLADDVSLARLPRESVAAAALLALDARHSPRSRAARTQARRSSCSPRAASRSFRSLPSELATPSLRLAVLPALGARLVRAPADDGVDRRHPPHRALDQARRARSRPRARCRGHALGDVRSATSWSATEEKAIAVAVLVGVFAFSLGASLGHRGLVPAARAPTGGTTCSTRTRSRRRAALSDRRIRWRARRTASSPTPAGVGAVYGSFLILDGISSRPLALGRRRRLAP